MPVRGVRGATVVDEDQPEKVIGSTRELLEAILEGNPTLKEEDIASIFFTVTDDLHSTYPARAARELGWDLVPLMCGREIPVPSSPARCIRVLIHWNTDLPQHKIQHVYLGKASTLRPHLAKKKLG
jgi:chorismate mutase